MFRFLLFLSCFIFITPAYAQGVNTAAKQAIVIDYDTGAVLYAKNADERMPTSSMSKVMSMYVVFDALKSGAVKLDDKMLVSEKAWKKGGSKMFVEVDKRVKVEDLIRGVIVQSGNDATIVLAEGLAGSENGFADKLNEAAKALGMNSSQFKNASGWPDPEHYSTASDLAILAKALIKNFPEYYKYYAEKEFTFSAITQQNRNPLLYKGIGADGIKTGHTEAGGYGLIGSGIQSGRRVIIVVNGLADEKARAEESGKLLEWGLSRFANKEIFAAGQPVESVAVVQGQAKEVGAVLKAPLLLTLPKLNEGVAVKAKFQAPLKAPVQKGQEIGALEVSLPYGETITAPLYAAQDVPALGFFSKALHNAKRLITGS